MNETLGSRAQLSYDLSVAVLTTADTFVRESQRLFRPHGLTGAQFNVLNVLAARTDGLSQRELSDTLVVDRSNVTGLLDRMEKAGWVERSDHPTDRRVYLVRLTTTGRRLWEKVHPEYLAAVTHVSRGLSPRQMADCVQVLQKLRAGVATWSENER